MGLRFHHFTVYLSWLESKGCDACCWSATIARFDALQLAWIDSSFTRIRAQRRSVPSLGWITYETLQLLLDRVPSRIGRAQAVGVVDWDRRIERSRAFLTTLSERVEDERLGRAFRKRVQLERPDVPALLGAGLALAGA